MQKLISASEDNLILPTQPELSSSSMSLLRVVKRNILPIVGIAGIITTGVWFGNRSTLPSYEGTFQILVEPASSEAKLTDPSNLTGAVKPINAPEFEMDYPTIIALLKSPKMLSSVVTEIQSQYPEITVEKLLEELTIERVAEELTVKSSGPSKVDQTKIIKVNYQNEDPKIVQLVLEAVAKKYLEYSLDERKSHIGQGVEFIEQQLPELYSRVNSLQVNLQNLQEQNKLFNPETKEEDLSTQISLLKAQQVEAQSQLNQQKALKISLQQQLKISPEEAIVISTLSADPNYQLLLQKYKETESEISIESARFQVDTPSIQKLEDKKQNLLQLLDKERQKLLRGNSLAAMGSSPLLNFQNTILMGMTQKLVDAISQEKLLEAQNQTLAKTITEYEQQALKIPQVSRQYTKLQQELAIANQTLQQLLTQKDNLSVELAQSQIPWEVVSEPQLIKDANGDPVLVSDSEKILLTALIGGLLVGITATAFLEKFHNIFYSAEDIEDTIKSPLLETISLQGIPEQLSLPLLTSGIQDSLPTENVVVESFKSLYANLRMRYSDPAIGSVLVSSAVKEDESTVMIALNLAKTAAAAGQKVLLVDANLSAPLLHQHTNLSNEKGLSNLLSNQMNSAEVIQQSSHSSNLFILTSGQLPANAIEQVTFNRMPKLIEEFQQSFDLVIYNASPILESIDTSFMATYTDGIVMTVAINKSKKSLFNRALQQIDNYNLKLLGVVSTDV
jgi:polysaccharide biosynthesis transport protein